MVGGGGGGGRYCWSENHLHIFHVNWHFSHLISTLELLAEILCRRACMDHYLEKEDPSKINLNLNLIK